MKVSILVTLSRPECIDLVKENLAKLEKGSHECETVVIVDNRNIGELDIDAKIERMPNAFKPSTGNIPAIRTRISEVRNVSRDTIGNTEFVFSFEDDTHVPSNAMVKLLDDFEQMSRSHSVGLVSGIQVGRHGRRVLGAWYADNYQFPTEVVSLGPKEIVTPLAEVDGTGFYCYVTPTKLYKQATYGWNEPMGPDAWYGFWLRTKGLFNYVDQSIVCGHQLADKRVLVPDDEVRKVRFYKQNNHWINDIVREAKK